MSLTLDSASPSDGDDDRQNDALGRLPALPYGLSYGWAEPDPEDELDEPLWLRFDAKEILPVRVLMPTSIKYWGHWYPAVGAYRLCQAQRDRHGRVLLTGGCPLCPRPVSELPAAKPLASPGRLRHLLTVQAPGGAQRIWEFSEPVAKQMQQITGWQRGRPTPQEPGGAITRERELLGLRLLLRRIPPKSNGAVIVALDPEPEPWGAMPVPIDAAGYVTEGWRRAALRDGKAMPTLPALF